MSFLRSIRARFTAWYLLVLAVLLIFMAGGLYLFVGRTLYGSVDDGLIHRAGQLASFRDVPTLIAEGRFEGAVGEVVGFYVQTEAGYRITSTHLVENALDMTWVDAAFEGEPSFVTVTTQEGQSLRFYITRFRPALPAGSPATRPEGAQEGTRLGPPGVAVSETGEALPSPEPTVLVVAQPLDRVMAAMSTLRGTLLIAVPLTLLLSAGGGLFLVRRALRPIDRMVAATREIEETDLSRRVAIRSDDELGRLARTLNAMLDRLERAFRRQRQFTDDASHELRSPLSVIEAEATLALRRERSAEDYRGAIATIAEEASSMNRLIDQLLTLARSDAGEESMEIERLDLSELASETVAAMEPVAEEAGVTLAFDGAASAPVEVDPLRIRRVIANLVENAIRYTPSRGQVGVEVHTEGHEAILSVTDTGMGIPAKDLPHIFERFYRVDKARSRSEGGSGLGLAICESIVETHHGTLSVTSQIDVGSQFIVRLPLRGGTADRAANRPTEG